MNKKKIAKKQGTPVQSFRIDPEIRAALEREARAQDRSISWLINNYIKNGLGVADRAVGAGA